MTDKEYEESDQLPEEGQPSEVNEDEKSQEARDEAKENPGAADEEGQATGNPRNAG